MKTLGLRNYAITIAARQRRVGLICIMWATKKQPRIRNKSTSGIDLKRRNLNKLYIVILLYANKQIKMIHKSKPNCSKIIIKNIWFLILKGITMIVCQQPGH